MNKFLTAVLSVVVADLAAKAIIKYTGVLDKTNAEINKALDELEGNSK